MKNIPALTGLRGIAVLLVMAFHAQAPFMQGGFMGVDLFFVLSGFLITSLLVREYERGGSISFRGFYARRARRLLPALFLLIAVVWLASYAIPFNDGTARGIWASLGYVANWVRIAGGSSNAYTGLFGHTWSLSIEEQFYLLWPPLLWVLLRHFPLRKIAWFVGCAVGFVAIERTVLALTGASPERLYFGTDTRADCLLVGALVGILYCMGVLPALARFVRPLFWPSVVALVACLMFLPIYSPLLGFGGYTVVALLFAVVLIHAVCTEPATLSWKPLVSVGTISYGLYLWHGAVFALVRSGPLFDTPLLLLGATLFVFAISLVSYRYVEQPIRKLRLTSRLRNRPTQKPGTA